MFSSVKGDVPAVIVGIPQHWIAAQDGEVQQREPVRAGA